MPEVADHQVALVGAEQVRFPALAALVAGGMERARRAEDGLLFSFAPEFRFLTRPDERQPFVLGNSASHGDPCEKAVETGYRLGPARRPTAVVTRGSGSDG